MGEVPAWYLERLNLQEQLDRIERTRVQTSKLNAEAGKLVAEANKLGAEQLKLAAEALKLGRDRVLAPWLAIAGLVGGIITVISALAHFGH
jgi:hypothetical protein